MASSCEIRITLVERDPPTGWIAVDVGCPGAPRRVSFEGWLGLLHLLADAVGTEVRDADAEDGRNSEGAAP